jgi:hypothetical protein
MQGRARREQTLAVYRAGSCERRKFVWKRFENGHERKELEKQVVAMCYVGETQSVFANYVAPDRGSGGQLRGSWEEVFASGVCCPGTLARHFVFWIFARLFSCNGPNLTWPAFESASVTQRHSAMRKLPPVWRKRANIQVPRLSQGGNAAPPDESRLPCATGDEKPKRQRLRSLPFGAQRRGLQSDPLGAFSKTV